jgi:quercetin dioxygenase-like cupin family protein
MSSAADHFPPEITALEPYVGAFDAFKLTATDCDVLFASYPAGSAIPAHHHDTDNVGVITLGQLILTVDGVERSYATGEWYHVPAGVEHAARFEQDSAEIEFWFRT